MPKCRVGPATFTSLWVNGSTLAVSVSQSYSWIKLLYILILLITGALIIFLLIALFAALPPWIFAQFCPVAVSTRMVASLILIAETRRENLSLSYRYRWYFSTRGKDRRSSNLSDISDLSIKLSILNKSLTRGSNYIDSVIPSLRLSDYGCHLRENMLDALFMLMIFFCCLPLSRIFKKCLTYAVLWASLADHLDMQFNPKKSCLFNIGKGYIKIAYKIYLSKTKKLFGWIELDI